jgi:hypothetical protein
MPRATNNGGPREEGVGGRKYHPLDGGKCRVPMWIMGCPAGFCDDVAYGEQLPREILYRDRHYDNRDGCRPPYCHGPCCPGHGGPREGEVRFFQDGLTSEGRVMWCAVYPDFINLQESPAGFDGNALVAREKLRARASADAQPTGGNS